uniref:DUF2059 domain-containing protein n=1 Tax=Panagrellus redivivus TaxID=6233 RepID=A0A7E4WB69_PANRE
MPQSVQSVMTADCKTVMMSSFLVLTLLLINFPVVFAFGDMKATWDYLLPRSIIDQIHAIEADDNLSPLGIERSINKVLCTLPLSTLRLLETPKYFQLLPEVAQWQIREVLYHANMSHDMKQDIIADLVARLPPDAVKFPEHKPNETSMFFESYHAIVYRIQFTFSLAELQSKLYSDDFAVIEDAFSNFTMPAAEQMLTISDVLSRQSPETQKALFTAATAQPKISESNQPMLMFFDAFNEKMTQSTKSP